MKYFFLRHGQAGWDAPSDAARQLTPKGEHDVCEVIKHHQTQLAGIELIVHSPMVRARQSAYLAGQWLNVSQYVEDIHWTPNRSIEEAYAALETYQNTHILVVGHNPLLSEMVGDFCHGSCEIEPFDTATLVGVEADWPATNMGTVFLKS